MIRIFLSDFLNKFGINFCYCGQRIRYPLKECPKCGEEFEWEISYP